MSTYPPGYPDRLRPSEAIAVLGDTLELVRLSMFEIGVRGWMHSSGVSPIARYLRLVCTDFGTLRMSRIGWSGIETSDSQCLDYRFPKPVVEFLTLFQQGCYPQLTLAMGEAPPPISAESARARAAYLSLLERSSVTA